MKEKLGNNFHCISTIQSSVKNHPNNSVNVSKAKNIKNKRQLVLLNIFTASRISNLAKQKYNF